MKTRFAILLVVVLGVVIAGLLVGRGPGREPRYQGRRLSYWFKEYYRYGVIPDPSRRDDEARGREAVKAIRAIGTNAVPFLVADYFSTNQDSFLKTNLLPVLGKLGFPPLITSDQIRYAASEAIFEIKPPASVLLPHLIPALRSNDPANRSKAIFLLGGVGEGAEATVPHLIAGLRSTNFWEQFDAVFVARRLGLPVKAVVPELIELLQKREQQYMPSRVNLQRQVEFALGSFGTNAASAIPVLLDMLKQQDDGSWRCWGAAIALTNVGCEKRVLVAELVKKMDAAADDASRFRVTTLLLSVDSTNAMALAVLMEYAKPDSKWRENAILELGKLGSAARPALPLIREAATNGSNILIRQKAQKALENIEAASTNQDSRPQ